MVVKAVLWSLSCKAKVSKWLGCVVRLPNDVLPKKLLSGQVKGDCPPTAHQVALRPLLVMFHSITVKPIASIHRIGMLSTDCCGETILALHVPSSSRAGKRDHQCGSCLTCCVCGHKSVACIDASCRVFACRSRLVYKVCTVPF